MKQILYGAAGLLLFSDAAFSQSPTYPKYTEAVSHFFNTTSLSDYEKPEVSFEKKKEGWFAKVTEGEKKDSIFTPDTLVKIWNAVTGHYTDTTLVEDTTDDDLVLLKEKYVSNWEKIHYDACPYFGYREWSKDVVKDFADYKGNDVETIYGIGRAYSYYADDLLSAKNGTADSSILFPLKTMDDKLSQQQLETYRFYRHKGMEFYTRVMKLKPSFQTLVGSIKLKLEGEYVMEYIDLMMYSTEQEALHDLPDTLYSPFHREFGYNLLMSCEKNGILFANGDLDTFVPLYMQLKEGIRRDVTVINMSLLAMPRYRNYLKKYRGITFSLKAAASEGDLGWVYLEDDSYEQWTADKVIKFLNDKKNQTPYENFTYATLPVKRLVFKCLKHPITWRADVKYVSQNQLMMIDIINSNLKNRPVFFSVMGDADMYVGYDHYLSKQNLVYKLTDKYSWGDRIENVDVEKSFAQAMNVFHWDNADKAVSAEKLLSVNYRISMVTLAEILSTTNKPDSAGKIIDLYLRAFSNEHLAFDYFMLPLARACYNIERFEQGNEIVKKIVYNYRHDIDPIDDDVIHTKSPKYENLVEDVKKVMKEYEQDTSILDKD